MYDKWSLDVLYSGFDDEKFQNDLIKLDELIAQYQEFASTLGSEDTKTTLKKALLLTEELQGKMGELSSFCSLVQATNSADPVSTSYGGKLMQKGSATTKSSTLINKYISGIDNLDEVIGDDPLLTEYSFYLHEIQNVNKYSLNEDVEEALSIMNASAGSAWGSLYGYLTSSVKVDFRGETTTLPAIRNLARSADAATRKEAYDAEIACYEKIKDSIAFSLNSIKMQDINDSKLRGFASPLDKVLFRSRLQRSTLDALLEAINEYLPNIHDYLKAKAETLGYHNGLPWYDLYAPLGSCDKLYTPEEAHAYLVHIFAQCNPPMAKIADRAFKENWIDFFPRKGKSGGASCPSLKSVKQFRVLTNYNGTFDAMLTVAHELGHGYHNFMIFDNRPLNMKYTMPVAETASNFNENLIINYAIDHASSDDEKLSLIEGQLSDLAQNICDIYSRFLFESSVVDNRSNKFMFADDLCNLMLDAQKKAYGDGLDPDFLHPYMWIAKGHYYSAGFGFYNFPYAFGSLFARGLYMKFKQQGAPFLEKYNQMLKETPVKSNEDVAKICDIDLTSKDFWLMCLHSYDDVIAEFKTLVK